MRHPEWLDLAPSELKAFLLKLKQKIDDIVNQYGSLKVYGRTPIETIEELAVVYYFAKKVTSYRELAKFLGMDHTSIYRLIKRVEQKNKVYINGKTIEVKPEELLEIANAIAKPKARKWLKSVMDSVAVQEFLANPVKRHKSSKHGLFYTKKQVNETIKAVNELAIFITKNKDMIEKVTKMEATNNPDMWTEDFIRTVIDMYCAQKHTDSYSQLKCRRKKKQLLRRLPKFKDYFAGEIGSVKQVIRPKESTIFLEHYYKLKKLALGSDNPELKALWLIVGLHVWSGAREGWGSLANKIQRLEAQGVKLKVKGYRSIDLDDDLVDSSLIGIKWSNAKWSPEGELIGFEIYESKTMKWWNLSINWLDDDIPKQLTEVYNKTAKPKRINSVIKSILVYYKVKPPRGKEWTVGEFEKWYTTWIGKLNELLGLPWKLTPHRLRSGHIAILAELRIPMEMGLSNTGFGVGWDDASTALIFYLRFSRALVRDYIEQAKRIKQQILNELS